MRTERELRAEEMKQVNGGVIKMSADDKAYYFKVYKDGDLGQLVKTFSCDPEPKIGHNVLPVVKEYASLCHASNKLEFEDENNILTGLFYLYERINK